MTGLFVSNFIGERIVISGLKKEKKVTDKTEEEVEAEDIKIQKLENKMDFLIREVAELKNELAKK
jgi:chaperonin cofactor prefoldin